MAVRKTKKRAKTQMAVTSLQHMIHVMRGHKVMLDADLAALYGVETKALNQAVKRNAERFPSDFMFQFSDSELENWRSQIVMSNPDAKMGLRRSPYAFTELGVAMLSSVLRSPRAIQTNIAIMRAFSHMRELIAHHKDFAARVEKLEKNHERADSIIEILVEDIDRIARDVDLIKHPPLASKKRIGYIWHDE